MSNNIEAPRVPTDLFISNGRVHDTDILKMPELEVETRVLPLGEFSEFVLTEQPRLLTAIRAKELGVEVIIQRQRELLTCLSPETIEVARNNPKLARIAMLDLTFAINAAILAVNPPSGSNPPDEVERLSAHFTQVTGLPRTMTFEKVVSVNSELPFEQMRAFTEGEVGRTERMFYYGHELMNTILQQTTDTTANVIESLPNFGMQSEAEVSLQKAGLDMNKFSEFMTAFMKMPTEHFAIFRQYLAQYPDGTRNASAAFIGMPRLNLRLMGSVPFYEEFLDIGMRYFPILEQPDIQQARTAVHRGDYLIGLCEKLDNSDRQKLAELLKQIIEPLHQFRLTHFAAVLKYLPPQAVPEGGKDLKAQLRQPYESISEDNPNIAKGTGGFLPGPLLRNMLRLDLQALERLDLILKGGD